MITTVPISFFVVRHILNELICHKVMRRPRASVKTMSLGRHLALTLSIFIVALGITLVVSSMELVMSISGSIGAVTLVCSHESPVFALKFISNHCCCNGLLFSGIHTAACLHNRIVGAPKMLLSQGSSTWQLLASLQKSGWTVLPVSVRHFTVRAQHVSDYYNSSITCDSHPR
mgnify:FL=1